MGEGKWGMGEESPKANVGEEGKVKEEEEEEGEVRVEVFIGLGDGAMVSERPRLPILAGCIVHSLRDSQRDSPRVMRACLFGKGGRGRHSLQMSSTSNWSISYMKIWIWGEMENMEKMGKSWRNWKAIRIDFRIAQLTTSSLMLHPRIENYLLVVTRHRHARRRCPEMGVQTEQSIQSASECADGGFSSLGWLARW